MISLIRASWWFVELKLLVFSKHMGSICPSLITNLRTIGNIPKSQRSWCIATSHQSGSVQQVIVDFFSYTHDFKAKSSWYNMQYLPLIPFLFPREHIFCWGKKMEAGAYERNVEWAKLQLHCCCWWWYRGEYVLIKNTFVKCAAFPGLLITPPKA